MVTSDEPTKIVTYGPWNLSWSRPGYGSHEPINLREATIAVREAELSRLDGAIADPAMRWIEEFGGSLQVPWWR
jgi:hypothetical protein